MAGILPAQAGQLNEAIAKLERLKGLEPHLKDDPRPRAPGGRPVPRRGGAPVPGGHDPIEVIKWRDMYTALEKMIDSAEDAGEVMERILAKGQ